MFPKCHEAHGRRIALRHATLARRHARSQLITGHTSRRESTAVEAASQTTDPVVRVLHEHLQTVSVAADATTDDGDGERACLPAVPTRLDGDTRQPAPVDNGPCPPPRLLREHLPCHKAHARLVVKVTQTDGLREVDSWLHFQLR